MTSVTADEVAFRWLPSTLRRTEKPAMAVLAGAILALSGSLLLSLLIEAVFAIFPAVMADRRIPDLGAGWQMLLGVVVFAPIVETLIMAGVLSALLRVTSPTAAVLLSSAAWGIAHSLIVPQWGLIIWWPFLIFSTLFLVWRQRGWGVALSVPTGAHALNNLIPAILLQIN